jgi:hypothetical protein
MQTITIFESSSPIGAKRNGTWHMTRHKADENAAPENWSGAVIRPSGDLCQDNGKGGVRGHAILWRTWIASIR